MDPLFTIQAMFGFINAEIDLDEGRGTEINDLELFCDCKVKCFRCRDEGSHRLFSLASSKGVVVEIVTNLEQEGHTRERGSV